MPFKKGQSGNPNGRPKGSLNHNGLTTCLNALEEIVSKEGNVKLLKQHFDKAFKKNPLKFYYRFCMPLLPKSINLEHSGSIEATATITLKPLKKNGNNNKK